MSTSTVSTLDSAELKGRIERFQSVRDDIVTQVRKVIVGQEEVIEQVMIALFVGGHCLITGFLAPPRRCWCARLSQALGLEFRRIQFTPDLMPSDITGTDIIEEDPTTGRRTWTFVPGPIFANVLLADEINRTPPKTQSALLEAMQELSCTVRGNHYKIRPPFFVLATQNPIELEGTYPLPEAQLDRFIFNTLLDYLSADDEMQVLDLTTTTHVAQVEAVTTCRRDSGLPAGGPHGADRGFGRALCRQPGARHSRHRLSPRRFRQEVRKLRRQRARGAVSGSGVQGPRADAPSLPRDVRRCHRPDASRSCAIAFC